MYRKNKRQRQPLIQTKKLMEAKCYALSSDFQVRVPQSSVLACNSLPVQTTKGHSGRRMGEFHTIL